MIDFTAYDPISIEPASRLESPPDHHVAGVPWIAHARAYCQSTSLQMIAEWRSRRERPLGFYNWLMGFTYGAGHLRGSLIFLPYEDPEAGFRFAAPFLGLRHRYYVSDDAPAYVQAAKTSVAGGAPIRIMLDSATLKGRRDYFSPHSIVVVGYRGDDACVYETRTDDKREDGARGQEVPWSLILEASKRVSETYRYPWTFQFTRFDPIEPVPLDETRVWARNARSLLGADIGFAATGAAALRSLASELEREGGGPAGRWDDLKIFFDYGVYTRADNAAYLTVASAGRPQLQEAARCLTAASQSYAAMTQAIDADGESARPALIAELLRASAREAEAGCLLADSAGAHPVAVPS